MDDMKTLRFPPEKKMIAKVGFFVHVCACECDSHQRKLLNSQ